MLTNCDDNPYNTPVKKLISSKVEALVLKKRHELNKGLFRDTVFRAIIFCSDILIMFPFCQKNANLNLFVFKGYQIENILQLLTGLQFIFAILLKEE